MLRRKRRGLADAVRDRRYVYSEGFQRQIVRCCLVGEFLKRNRPLLSAGFLAYEALRLVAGSVLRVYDRTGDAPSLSTVRQDLIERGELGPDVETVLRQLRRAAVGRADQAEVQSRIRVFVEHARLETDLADALELLRSGELDDARDLVHRALVSQAPEPVYDYGADIEARLKSYGNGSQLRQPVPTGFESIDAALEGGLGRGELAFAIAPTGTGKSILLVNLGFAGLVAGAVVAHYTLELPRAQVARRYDMRLAGLTKKELKALNSKAADSIRRALDWQKAKLFVREFPMRILTPAMLLADLAALPEKPGLVLVDYADVMAGPRRREKDYLEARDIYEALKGIAQQLQVPLWTASQGNRLAESKRYARSRATQTISLANAADAYAKSAPADVVISLNLPAGGKGSWIYVAKVREGKSGFEVPIEPLYHRMILREKGAEDADQEESAPPPRRRARQAELDDGGWDDDKPRF